MYTCMYLITELAFVTGYIFKFLLHSLPMDKQVAALLSSGMSVLGEKVMYCTSYIYCACM